LHLIFYKNICLACVYRTYDSDEAETWSLGEDGGLIKKDKSSTFCPVKPCHCVPDYILASGGAVVSEAG